MIIKMKHTIFFIFLLISFLGGYKETSAQELGIGESINFEMVPEIPKAGDLVGVFLNSYVTNIDLASITWKLNGKIIKSGVGEKKFEFTMGNESTVTNLNITIKTQEGATFTKDYSLRPTSVDMILESDGSVHPFYKGKNLFTHQNNVSIIAVPHIIGTNGIELNPKNMVYKWKKNGSVVESASGYSKNAYKFEGALISRPVNISVEISSDQGLAYGNLVLTPTDPFILFYKKDPTLGIQYQKVLDSGTTLKDSKEITIVAQPYFFDSSSYFLNSLIYRWSINGRAIQDDGAKKQQTFRQNEGSSGTANIALSIENPDKILQFTQKNMMLSFTNE